MIKNIIFTFITLALYEAFKRFPAWDRIKVNSFFIWRFISCKQYRDIALYHYFEEKVNKNKAKLQAHA